MVATKAGIAVLSVVAAGASILALAAHAQTSAPNKNPGSAIQDSPSHFDAQADHRKGESLSERLDRSDGVIKPPTQADSDMHVAPPPTGDKMAIPPSAVNPAQKNDTPK